MSGRIFFLFTILLTRSLQEKDKFLESVIPENYKIRILALIDELKFEGIVDILVESKEDTNEVTLHAGKITFSVENITVTDEEKSEEIYVDNINTEKNYLLRMNLKNDLLKNKKYNIHIEYTGELGLDPYGFYIDHYDDEEGKEHSIAVTYFEPTWARDAFPCFDLPHMKATFEVTIGRNEKLFTLSNMPLAKSESIEGKEGWFWDHFEKTLPMSTYLVAFSVLDEGMKNISSGKIRFWFPPIPKFHKESILEKTQKMLNFLEEFFGIKYDLPKLDFLVVNNYPIYSGALESWGLITVRSSALEDEEFIIGTVAHELVHQWIGNIVTMKCFGELWLKEGITTYFTKFTKNMISDGQTLDIDIVRHFLKVLSNHLSDQLSRSDCSEDIDDIVGFFVSNTYNKGALFTRMIQLALGLKDFRKTANLILTKHKYHNFDENDLWVALKNTTSPENFHQELEIDIILKSWTRQDGFPLVIVSRNYDTGIATVTQRKFYFIDPDEETTQCWWIPLSYTTKSDFHNSTVPKLWMECPKKQIIIHDVRSSDWILMNLQSTGLFIVKYDDDNWKLITQTLRDEKSYEVIPYWNRFRLILDTIYLTDFGLSTHESLLTTLLYLKHENELVVWVAALKYFSKIDWLDNEILQLKNEYMKLLVQPHFSKLLFNSTKSTSKKNEFNKIIIKEACSIGIEECIEEYSRIFFDFKASFPNVSSLNTDLLKDIFCFAVRTGPEENKKFLTNILPQIVDNNQLKMKVYNSLINPSCSKTSITPKEQINRKIAAIFINEPPQRRHRLAFQGDVSLLSNSALKEFLDKPHSSPTLIDTMRKLADNIHDGSERKRLEEFFENNKDKLIRHKKSTDEIIRTMKRNEEWKKNYSKDIKNALLKILGESNKTATITSTTTTTTIETTPEVLRFVPDDDSKSVKLQNGLICPVVIFIYYVLFF